MAKQAQTLTRDAIQYETKRDFSKSQHSKQNKRYKIIINIHLYVRFILILWQKSFYNSPRVKQLILTIFSIHSADLRVWR